MIYNVEKVLEEHGKDAVLACELIDEIKNAIGKFLKENAMIDRGSFMPVIFVSMIAEVYAQAETIDTANKLVDDFAASVKTAIQFNKTYGTYRLND